jgi:predicted metal-dependent phosphoesterase TrpH
MDMSNKKIAFHIHTKYSSDCNSEPSQIVDTLVSKGISIAIITDHNTIRGAIEAKRYAEEKYKNNFQVIVGEEVLSDIGDIIGFPIIEEIAPGNHNNVIQIMKRQKASICLPHPYKSHNLFLIHEEKFIQQFDFIEVFNSRINSKLNSYAEELCEKYNKIPIIGIDAHTIEDLGNCFLTYNDRMEIIDSLRTETRKRNIRKSQVINARKKNKRLDIIKYQLLSIINR